MATTIDLAQLQTLTIKQLKAQIAELTGQTLKSNNRPYLIGKLTKALEAKAAAEAEQARQAKKAKTTRKAATKKSTKAEKAEKAERRTRTAQRKAGERHTQERLIDRFLLKPVQVVDLDGLWDEEEVTRNEEVTR